MARSWTAENAPVLKILDVLGRPFMNPCSDPVWVFGIQKAGTTVFAKALAIAVNKTSLLDTPVLWDRWTQAVSAKTLGAIMRNHPVTFSPTILKEPTATFFPEACLSQTTRKHHVLLVRDPAANIRSAMDRMGLPGNSELPNGARIRPEYKAFFASKEWTPPVALAHRWVMAHSAPAWLSPNIQVFLYEDFIQQPTRIIEQAANHLGFEVVNNIEGTLNQQHQPAGANRAKPLEEFYGVETLDKIRHITQPAFDLLRSKIRSAPF